MCKGIDEYSLQEIIDIITRWGSEREALDKLLERCHVRRKLAQQVNEELFEPVSGYRELARWKAMMQR
mgnify:CR=1 FL=1